ncbi:MAG TPA: circadian clock protein KaiC [Thermoanaerobaculia bacterium]|jgi:circadian clock protein KaiC|nr:circadian clock protein KaiC [Thermoanaerobaculia bacterium]
MSAAEILEASTGSTLVKSPTGIQGLDEVTGGGLPAGRPTLICGSAGCGKTLFAIEFLVHGAIQYGEPGVFFAFEETPEELTQNVRSLGFDLDDLVRRNLLSVDYIHIERSEIEETGEYDLEGLFLRLGFAIDSIGAKRVALDTLETLFGGLGNEAVLRSELRRLFRWLKDRQVTAVITAERGDGALTRYGLEEYVSDCVILLDNRVIDQAATRRLRVVKYRGSAHGTNEYPFLIDEGGLEVLPITAAGLKHAASRERVSTGVPQLDAMLGGGGYYRGSSVLVSGTAGSGKSSLSAHFAAAACKRGERCVYFAFEESEDQVVRNMSSIGVDLATPLRQGKLLFHATRPTLYGLEGHLAIMHKRIREADPQVVIIDPISTFLSVSNATDVKALFVRLMDFLKEKQITAFFTSLTTPGGSLEQTDVGLSSLIDTWLLLRDLESGGERNRGLYVLKSRGMSHSNQVREFLLTDHGIELVDVCLGPEGVLTGSARRAQAARERTETAVREEEIARQRRELDLRRQVMEARIATLRTEFKMEEEQLERLLAEEGTSRERLAQERAEMVRGRQTGSLPPRDMDRTPTR